MKGFNSESYSVWIGRPPVACKCQAYRFSAQPLKSIWKHGYTQTSLPVYSFAVSPSPLIKHVTLIY